MAKRSIEIHVINKISYSAPENQIISEYSKRIPWNIIFHQLEFKQKFSPEKQKEAEGILLLKSIPQSNFIITLDERGSLLDSYQFSKLLLKQIKPVSFIIGGAFGLSEEIKNKSNKIISLSKLTFPHMLVRAILVEQIYRAYTIGENHPYHK